MCRDGSWPSHCAGHEQGKAEGRGRRHNLPLLLHLWHIYQELECNDENAIDQFKSTVRMRLVFLLKLLMFDRPMRLDNIDSRDQAHAQALS
jgi:hypothetical protein